MPTDKEIDAAVTAYYPGQTVHEAQRQSVYSRMRAAISAAEQVRAEIAEGLVHVQNNLAEGLVRVRNNLTFAEKFSDELVRVQNERRIGNTELCQHHMMKSLCEKCSPKVAVEQVRASEPMEADALVIRRWMQTKGYLSDNCNSLIQLLNSLDYQARGCGEAAERVRQTNHITSSAQSQS